MFLFPATQESSGSSPAEPLQICAADATVARATPDKRKRACMARRGQVGRIEISGNRYVVRFWKYPPGQDRIHASERICPTDPKAPGYRSKGERRIRANEIVVASGVNDAKHFAETHVG